MEENGAPVVDLVADDFTIKEDGKDRDVLKVELARVPMQIAIIVDDNGSGIFRSGLVNFVQLLQGRAEMSLSSVMGQTQRLVDYTPSAQKLVDAIVQLSARPATPDGGQLLEGIFQAAKDQEKREASRPVIVAVTVGGEEHSTLPAHHVLDQLAKSGSALYVISVANSAIRQTRAIDKPSLLLEENLNLSEVLGEGPKQSGGSREVIVAAPGITVGLQRIAAELKNQYAVAYSRPAKGRSTEKLSVSVKRSGVLLRAPTRRPVFDQTEPRTAVVTAGDFARGPQRHAASLERQVEPFRGLALGGPAVGDGVLVLQLRGDPLQPLGDAGRGDDYLARAAALFRALAEHLVQVEVLVEERRRLVDGARRAEGDWRPKSHTCVVPLLASWSRTWCAGSVLCSSPPTVTTTITGRAASLFSCSRDAWKMPSSNWPPSGVPGRADSATIAAVSSAASVV